MELIQNIFKFFENGESEQQYGEVSSDVKKLLFISPTVTSENFYRIIMPFTFLPSMVKTLQTAMLGIVSHNPTQLYEKRVTQAIKEDRIKWADVIVFPFTTQALKPLYDEIREIGREDNREIKIIYNFDMNVFHLPDSHPMKSFMTPEKLDGINDNILFSDLTLLPNTQAKKYFLEQHFTDNKFAERLNGISPCIMESFPYLAHYPAMYEDKAPSSVPNQKIRLAIPVNDTQYEELASFNTVLREVNTKLRSLVDIVVMGGRKSDTLFTEAMKGIMYSHIPAHPEVEMLYSEILKSRADVFLYLSKDGFYNFTSDDPKRIVDFGIVGIPCIIPAYSSMAEIVRPIGWVIDEEATLPLILEQVANHRATMDEHSIATFNNIIKNFSYQNAEALLKIASVFEI